MVHTRPFTFAKTLRPKIVTMSLLPILGTKIGATLELQFDDVFGFVKEAYI